MKIAYFNYLYDIKDSSVGASVHVEELAEALRSHGHTVRVYYMNKAESGGASRIVQGFKAFYRELFSQAGTLISNLFLYWREKAILRAFKPDAVLIRYNYLNISSTLAAFCAGLPVVLEVNAPMVYEKKRFTRGNLPLIPGWVERLNLRLADRVFVVSNMLKNFYAGRSVPECKIAVICNGVDINRFDPGSDGNALRSNLGLQNKVVLGFAGSFHYWHGVQSLIDFIICVLNRFSHTAFLLVGQGPMKIDMENRLKKYIEEGRVVMTGYVDHQDIPGILAVMDIALALYPDLPKFYYSPLKLFEYMAAGKAVIATRIGQIQEIVTHEMDGLLVNPDDRDGMIQAAGRLILHPEKRFQLGCRARLLVERNYTWKTAAVAVIGLIESASGSK
ncbi:MAG TPA: glycosyltransferase WbuB [bacterium]|mgnify:CR=1 FL=1|nr:glycosyltransferase WbuB [bacterium]